MKKLLLLAFVLLAALSFAQQVQTFNFTANSVALPGGKQTFAGTEAGMAVSITPNFDLLDTNLLGSGNSFAYFGGGFNYRLPVLSTYLNNISPNVNGLAFQFGLTASVGIDRISNTGQPTAQHYAFTGGGFANYFFNNTWSLGARVQYAKFPGYNNNTYVVELGPSLHF